MKTSRNFFALSPFAFYLQVEDFKKKMLKPISLFNITAKRVSLTATGPDAVVCACALVLVETIAVVGIIYVNKKYNNNYKRFIKIQKRLKISYCSFDFRLFKQKILTKRFLNDYF